MKVNKLQAATEVFGVAYNTINVWIDKGMPCVKVGNNFEIDVPSAIAWHVVQKTSDLKAKLDAVTSDVDYDAEYKRWRSVRMKIEAHKESGSLITVEEAEAALLQRLVVIREALKNVPLSWQHSIIGIDDAQTAQEVLEELLDDLLGVLSQAPDDIAHTVEGNEVLDIDVSEIDEIEDFDVR
jgi:phage terminase Nu1 subunit (DNA packaging protein)